MKDLTIVHVRWIDSCLYDGPLTISQFDGPAEMVTVGMLVTEDDTSITVALDYSTDNKNYRRAICIPRVCIKALEKFNYENMLDYMEEKA